MGLARRLNGGLREQQRDDLIEFVHHIVADVLLLRGCSLRWNTEVVAV